MFGVVDPLAGFPPGSAAGRLAGQPAGQPAGRPAGRPAGLPEGDNYRETTLILLFLLPVLSLLGSESRWTHRRQSGSLR